MDTLKRKEVMQLLFAFLSLIINKAIGQGSSQFNHHLLLGQFHSIFKVNPNDLSQLEFKSSYYPTSIDYDFNRNALIWSDINRNQIYTVGDGTPDVKILIPNKYKWEPVSINVDSVNDKLYVADAFTDTVQVIDLKDLTKHGIIIGSALSKIKSIVLDPYEGYLFILDEYQILRTDLDGSNPKVLYFKLQHVIRNSNQLVMKRKSIDITQISLDLNEKRLYWINTHEKTLESSDYNGEHNDVHYNEEDDIPINDPSSLTILNSNVYWTTADRRIFKIDLKLGDIAIQLENYRALNIKAIAHDYKRTVKVKNPCDRENGHCQHLCFFSKIGKENIKCSCNAGYILDKDGKSCTLPKDFLLMSQGRHLRGKILNANGHIDTDVINPSQFEVGTIYGLDFDARERFIFYSAYTTSNLLHQVHLDKEDNNILLPDFLSSSVGSVAYDWTIKNLYYISTYYFNMNSINVVNVNNPTYSKILVEYEDHLIRSLIIHPNRGYIYFVLRSKSIGSINRINTDGSGLKPLIKLSSSDILKGLAVDYNNDRIYFTETTKLVENTRLVRIRHCDLDGEDIQELIELESFEGNIISMAINEGWLYVNTGSILYRVNIRNGKLKTLVYDFEMSRSLIDIKVFNKNSQPIMAGHPCVNNPNNCEKFCFAKLNSRGQLKGVCGCPYGEKLHQDGKTCIDNSREEPPFLPCPDVQFKCKKMKATV